MWISRKKYDKLVKRMDKLENEIYSTRAWDAVTLGKAVDMLYDHLGVHIEKPWPYPKLVEKK